MKQGGYGLIIILALLAAAVGIAVVGPMVFEKSPPSSHASTKGTIAWPLSAKGVVESVKEIDISSQVRGIVREMLVDEGAAVKRGEALVRLDDAKLVARIELAEAALREARAERRELESGFRREDIAAAEASERSNAAIHTQARREAERLRRLYRQDAVTLVELDRAKEQEQVAAARLEEAQARLRKLRRGVRPEILEAAGAREEKARAELKFHLATLKDYGIESPLSGLVIERHADAGESVKIGTPLLRIIDPATLRIRAEVEETDVGRVREDQAVEVTADAFGDRVFRGRVSRVFPTVDKKAQKTFDPMASFDINTQKVHIHLEEFIGLVHGMTVTVKFLR